MGEVCDRGEKGKGVKEMVMGVVVGKVSRVGGLVGLVGVKWVGLREVGVLSCVVVVGRMVLVEVKRGGRDVIRKGEEGMEGKN